MDIDKLNTLNDLEEVLELIERARSILSNRKYDELVTCLDTFSQIVDYEHCEIIALHGPLFERLS